MKLNCKYTQIYRENDVEQKEISLACIYVSLSVYVNNKMAQFEIQLKTFRTMEYQCTFRTQIFDEFIRSVSHLINHHVLTLFRNKYYIKEFKIEQINEAKARTIYAGIISKSKKNNGFKNELNWLQNELRMFVWTLIFYAQSLQLEIENFTEIEWEFFLTIFPNKQRILFQYQAYNLLKKHNQYKKWGHQEDQIFQQLVKKDNYRLKWSDLGKNLFIESNRKYFRTPKQCRERWLNHLDPSKMKKGWLEEEDFLLIENVKLFGKKWANISKKLQNRRNQHSIKNRFKSLMTKESKLFLGVVNEKQLVDSLFSRMLQKKTNHFSQKQESVEIQQDKLDMYIPMEPKQYQNYDCDSERPAESIFDYCDQSQFFQKQKHSSTELLGNVSLNRTQNQKQKMTSYHSIEPQKHVFQFSKITNSQLINLENNEKSFDQQNEEKKRVRADLFLQQDPFQMLKSYFYKPSFSQ